MTVKEKLEEYNLLDQSIIRHGQLENIRDYEIIGYLCGHDFDLEVRYVFKGCIEVYYKNIVVAPGFSMDDRLLQLDRQGESDYPKAFIWDAGVMVYPGWKLIEETDDLKNMGKTYGLKLFRIEIETNAYNLTIVFHDLETTPLTRHEKKKTKVG